MIIAFDKHSARHAVRVARQGSKRKLRRVPNVDYTRAVEREYRAFLLRQVAFTQALVREKVLPVLRTMVPIVRTDVSVGTNKSAANAALYALRVGKIKKTACVECGNAKVIMHHSNYNKPLAVTWLCNSCHRKHHWQTDGNNAARSAAMRTDAVIDDVHTAIDGVRIIVKRPIEVAREVRTVAGKVAAANTKTIVKQTEAVLGIRPELHEPYLNDLMAGFVRTNVKLVGKVSDDFLDKIEARVASGASGGLRAESIADGIEQDFLEDGADADTALNRARLIARDQVSSFRGDLTKARQENLGITRFIWRTSEDERVRATHRQRDGLTFNWDDDFTAQLEAQGLEVDKIDGPPGKPINCRCVAEPVLEDLLDE